MSHRLILTTLAVFSLAACGHRDSDGIADHEDHGWGDAPDSAEVAQAAATSPEAPLGPGDIRIFSADSAVEMSLLGDHIVTGLGPKVLARIDKDMAKDTAGKDESGLGAMIAGAVKGTVRSALAHKYSFVLSDVRDVRYEHGAIVFDWKSKPALNLDDMKVNDRQLLESFSPDDARRFVAAVRARLPRT